MKLYGKKPDLAASVFNPLVVDWLMAMYPPAQKLELSAGPSPYYPGLELIGGINDSLF